MTNLSVLAGTLSRMILELRYPLVPPPRGFDDWGIIPISHAALELQRDVNTLMNDYKSLARQNSVMSDEKFAKKTNVTLASRLATDLDELCPRPWPYPWPRPRGWDYLLSGALIQESAERTRDPALKQALLDGAAKLLQNGLNEIEAAQLR